MGGFGVNARLAAHAGFFHRGFEVFDDTDGQEGVGIADEDDGGWCSGGDVMRRGEVAIAAGDALMAPLASCVLRIDLRNELS